MADWSLPTAATKWLTEHVPHGSTVLELGSGAGTRRLVGAFDVVTVEHDPAFMPGEGPICPYIVQSGETHTIRVRSGETHTIRYVHAPIVDGWYDADVIREIPTDYAAIIVDGPPGKIGRFGFAENLALFNTDVVILFDDVHREAEWMLALTVAEWVQRPIETHKLADGRAFAVIGAK